LAPIPFRGKFQAIILEQADLFLEAYLNQLVYMYVTPNLATLLLPAVFSCRECCMTKNENSKYLIALVNFARLWECFLY